MHHPDTWTDREYEPPTAATLAHDGRTCSHCTEGLMEHDSAHDVMALDCMIGPNREYRNPFWCWRMARMEVR